MFNNGPVLYDMLHADIISSLIPPNVDVRVEKSREYTYHRQLPPRDMFNQVCATESGKAGGRMHRQLSRHSLFLTQISSLIGLCCHRMRSGHWQWLREISFCPQLQGDCMQKLEHLSMTTRIIMQKCRRQNCSPQCMAITVYRAAS